MDRERELDNLNIMLESGLITEETYQAQRHALLGTPMVNTKLERAQKRLHPLSLLNAFKFSVRPAVFGANFVLLFVTVMFFLISLIIFFSCLKSAADSIMFFEPKTFVISGFIYGAFLGVFFVFWEAVWIAFFSRLALEQLERDSPTFEWKSFILKSLSLGALLLLFIVELNALAWGFVSIVDFLDLTQLELWQEYALGVLLIVAFVSILFVICYAQIALMTACIGSVKHWGKTVALALKRPLLILFALGGIILNVVIIFLLAKGWEYIAESLDDTFRDLAMTIISVSGLGVFGVYLVLGIISFLVYIALPERGKFWFKMSFLFVIPSLIILLGIFSILPVIPPLNTSFYFLYFIVMHFLWFLLYCSSFLIVQGMAFLAHILTQVWCHLTHDKAGSFLFRSPDDEILTEEPQKPAEEEYQIPEVFR